MTITQRSKASPDVGPEEVFPKQSCSSSSCIRITITEGGRTFEIHSHLRITWTLLNLMLQRLYDYMRPEPEGI